MGSGCSFSRLASTGCRLKPLPFEGFWFLLFEGFRFLLLEGCSFSRLASTGCRLKPLPFEGFCFLLFEGFSFLLLEGFSSHAGAENGMPLEGFSFGRLASTEVLGQLFLMGGGGGSSRPVARKDRSAEPGIQSNASMGAGACSFRTTVADR